MFDFDKIIDRKNTNCVKFDTAGEHGYPEDVLPLCVADMDFSAPACVQEALHKAVAHGIFGYSFLGEEYYAALENWFRQRLGWQIDRSWLVVTPGVVFALAAAVRAFTQPGDAVMIQTPVYSPFYQVVKENGRKLVESPLVYENGKYIMDFAAIEQRIRENGVKILILCSPHNPVCRVWSEKELAQLGSICKRCGVIVVSDEIHCDFAFPEHPHTPFPVACPELAEQTIVCTAPSKSFNLAGLQMSNIFIPGKMLREKFKQQMEKIGYTDPNQLSVVACTAAYTGGGPWLDACKAYMRENLNYVREFLQEHLPAIRLVEPEGTYFAWLDCSGLGMTEEELNRRIIHKAKLWLSTGSIFGNHAACFQRVVLACPRATVEEAMKRLYAAFQD